MYNTKYKRETFFISFIDKIYKRIKYTGFCSCDSYNRLASKIR